jgi:hypothetical protein
MADYALADPPLLSSRTSQEVPKVPTCVSPTGLNGHVHEQRDPLRTFIRTFKGVQVALAAI